MLMRLGQLPYGRSPLSIWPLAHWDPAVLTSAGKWSLGASSGASTASKCWTSHEGPGPPCSIADCVLGQKSQTSNPRTRRDHLSFQLIQMEKLRPGRLCCAPVTAGGKAGAVTLRVTSPFSHSLPSQEDVFCFLSVWLQSLLLHCCLCPVLEGLTGELFLPRRERKWTRSPVPTEPGSPPSSSQAGLVQGCPQAPCQPAAYLGKHGNELLS